jgi:hypothetical protein
MKNTQRKKPTPTFTWDRLDQLLADHRMVTPRITEVPPGAFTLDDFRFRYGVSPSTARHRLTVLVRAGRLRAGWTAGTDTNGRYRLIRCYWFPDEKGEKDT